MTQMLKEILDEPKCLKALEKNNKKTLTAIAQALNERGIKHVTFAARGTSDHASIYGQYLMGAIGGIVAGLATPSVTTLYNGSIDYSDSLVIAVSQSGSAADALAVIKQAKKTGAVTLAITNFPDSKLAKAADFHLWCSTTEETSVAATKTFTAELALLYLLCAYWFNKLDMLNDYADLIKSVDSLISKGRADVAELAKQYRFMREGFVLSRGFCYPIALETMLKVQETCYIKMKGYSCADFYHGPLAQIEADTPVILYAMKGAAQDENIAMYDKLVSVGAHPLLVTDDAKLAKTYAGNSFVIPSSGSELTQPIVVASFAQLFAEALCGIRGQNPDAPRNLHKVTITK